MYAFWLSRSEGTDRLDGELRLGAERADPEADATERRRPLSSPSITCG
jgi:hypothetical protein